MSTRQNTYDPVRGKDGITIEQLFSGGGMLADGKHQDIHTRSTAQNYDIGTRLAMDERVFRYAKSISDLTALNYAVINTHIIPDDGFEGAVSGSPVAGDRTITILDTGAAGARPVNYYAGAYIQMYQAAGGVSATNFDQQRRVIASTVGNGVSITLTLDFPLTCDVGATVDVYPCQYSEIGAAGSVASGHETFVGYAAAYLQALEFGWIQTWGPCNGHYNQHFPGDSSGDLANDRECVFNAAGEVITLQQMGSFVGVSYQRAGHIIPCTKSNYGSVMINLQIAP